MSRRSWLWLGGVTTALAILLGGAQILVWISQATERTSHTYQGAAGRISVELSGGDLDVVAGPAGEITVDRTLTYSLVRPHIEQHWDQARQSLVIDVGCHAVLGHCNAVYRLHVPPSVALTAKSGGGSITVQSITGDLDLHTNAGEVVVSDCEGRVNASSGSGEVWANRAASMNVTLTTVAGDVNATFVVPPQQVTATTQAGDVTIGVPSGTAAYDVKASTNSGDMARVGISNVPTADRRITAEAPWGDVTIRYNKD